MRKAEVAKPAMAKFAFPVEFVPMKHENLFPRVDYCRLSAVIERDSYAIPGMGKFIDMLRKTQVFSTFDANSGRWHFAFDEMDLGKTEFVTHHGLFKYTHMPLWL